MIKLGRAYLHKKSGNEVLVQSVATARINKKKFLAVVYLDSNSEICVRALDDFIEQCELINSY